MKTEKYIKLMTSVSDMKFWMAAIRDDAQREKNFARRNAYNDALYYLHTGRLSAAGEKAIFANINNVLKKLDTWQGGTTDDIGKYLMSFIKPGLPF